MEQNKNRSLSGGSQTYGRTTVIPLHLRKEFIYLDGSDIIIINKKLVGKEFDLGGYTNLKVVRDLISKVKDNRYFTNILPWKNSYGMRYEDGAIYLNEKPMDYSLYSHYVFNDPRNLNPTYEQWDNYRFLHELDHAYQGMLMYQDRLNLGSLNMRDETDWANKMRYLGQDRVNLTDAEFKEQYGDIEVSTYAKLFGYCYYLRDKYKNLANHRYLTTLANQIDYRHLEQETRYCLGAIEDSNELVSMFLWNPNYFLSYMSYLAGEITNFNKYKESDNLITITYAEKTKIIELVFKYIEEIIPQEDGINKIL